jgi:ABC-type multidrug transport system ATPase subunit/ABC-type multidrug transport system permease subunit
MRFEDPEKEKLVNDNSSLELDQVQQITVNWRNINLTVETNGQSNEILKDISGYANPHEMLAIMGMSGSGKTSLLSIISNHIEIKTSYNLTGTLKLNNVEYSEINPNRFMRYIAQDDELYDFLTPRETFKFFGKLQTNLSNEKINKKVNQIIHELKLERVADSIVGNNIIKGLSGGEKKRVSIGLNLVSDPSVIILDEPTSGLDSSIALSVMELIKNTCNQGITVILTIHQPSKSIFDLFDRLALMHKGQLVYQGPAKDSMDYFKSIDYPVPHETNPCDHFLTVLSLKNMEFPEEVLKKFHEAYKKLEPEILKKIDSIDETVIENEEASSGFFKALIILLGKAMISMKRNPLVLAFKLFQATAIGLFMALTFIDLGYDEDGIGDRSGAIIFTIINTIVLNIIFYSLVIANEKRSLMKNYKNGLYNFHSHFISFLLIEAVLAIPCSTFFTLISYWIIGFNDDSGSKVILFILITYCAFIGGAVYGLLASSVSDTITQATFVGPTIATIQGICGAVFTHSDTHPSGMAWLKYCSFMYYLRTAYYKNEFDDLDYDDDVVFEPDDRFGIEKSIARNLLCGMGITLFTYFVCVFIFWYGTKTIRLSKIFG